MSSNQFSMGPSQFGSVPNFGQANANPNGNRSQFSANGIPNPNGGYVIPPGSGIGSFLDNLNSQVADAKNIMDTTVNQLNASQQAGPLSSTSQTQNDSQQTNGSLFSVPGLNGKDEAAPDLRQVINMMMAFLTALFGNPDQQNPGGQA